MTNNHEHISSPQNWPIFILISLRIKNRTGFRCILLGTQRISNVTFVHIRYSAVEFPTYRQLETGINGTLPICCAHSFPGEDVELDIFGKDEEVLVHLVQFQCLLYQNLARKSSLQDRKAAWVGEWTIHRTFNKQVIQLLRLNCLKMAVMDVKRCEVEFLTGPLCPRDKSCFLLAFLLSHTQREVVASSGNIT